MKILIAYATYSGSTQTACEFLAEKLKEKNQEASMKTINELSFDEIFQYDLVIFASPTWDFEGKEGQPHQDFVSFMDKNKNQDLKNKEFAVIGLGDSSYSHFCGAVDIIEDFIKAHNGKIKTESLKIDGYLFDIDKNNNLIISWLEKIIA